MPLMLVAGDHAKNDMAGEDDDSWKSLLEKENYTVEPLLRGLGEYPAIRNIFIKHIYQSKNMNE
jgi:sirohydrochlorin cobaltochelatase